MVVEKYTPAGRRYSRGDRVEFRYGTPTWIPGVVIGFNGGGYVVQTSGNGTIYGTIDTDMRKA